MSELTELEKWAADMDDRVLLAELRRLRETDEDGRPEYSLTLQCECAGYLKALMWHDIIEATAFTLYLADIRIIARGVRHA